MPNSGAATASCREPRWPQYFQYRCLEDPRSTREGASRNYSSGHGRWYVSCNDLYRPAIYAELARPVTVRDVATLHVLASTLDIARGQRYLAIAHHYSNDQIAYVLRQRMPDLAYRIPAAENKPWQEHFMTDCSKVEKELGIRWTSFDQTVVDTANKLLEIETRLRKAH